MGRGVWGREGLGIFSLGFESIEIDGVVVGGD